MRVGFLTASVSRNGGGLFDAVRRLAAETASLPGTRLDVFGLEDANTRRDLAAWNGTRARAFAVRGLRSFGYAPGLLPALEEAGPDLVHCHGLWMYPSAACLSWAKRTGRPYLVSPHGMLDRWALKNSTWKKRLAGWLYQDDHLRRAVAIHALCESEARAIRAYGLRNPVCVIPNGVDLPEEMSSIGDSPLSKGDSPAVSTVGHWGQSPESDGAKVLLFLGRLHPKKGLPGLVRGWKLAQKQTKALREWELVIAGWDQAGHQEDLERLCREQGIEGVRFAGPQFGPDKAAVFQRAEAFVLPSFSEGLPMAVLEAWSYRLPVVMTPGCNLPEGFQAGAAIRVEPQSERIARGLTELAGMREAERRAMGRRGQRLVEEKFSWPKIARQMKGVYEWVLGGGPKPQFVI